MKWLKRYLSKEIDIEFKASLYFFCILFYYSVFQIINGRMEANILVMAEMVFSVYNMGYVQVYLLRNFDEGEHFGSYECLASLGCTLVYSGVAYLGKWFDRQLIPELSFAGYLMICYVCIFYVYKVRRILDTKELNQELENYKKRR